MECASEHRLFARTSMLYRINAVFQIAVCILTIVLSVKAIHVLHRHNVFNHSTRQLLFMSIIYADLHALAYGFLQSWSMYRSVQFADEPCQIMFSGDECYALTWITGAAKMSMIFVQVALTLERLIAIVSSCKPMRYQGSFLNVLVAIFALLSTTYSYSEGPTSIKLTSCLLQGDIPLLRVLHTLAIYLVLSLFCLLLNLIIIWSLKRPKKQSFNLNVRFTLQEVKNSAMAVCIISISQFITMTIYVSGSYTIFFLQHRISEAYFSSIILCIYTIPYAAVCLPVSVILCVKWISGQRKSKIVQMTTANRNDNGDGRICQLKNAWEAGAIQKEQREKAEMKI